jgi:tetratricopeptide (TPR) repeat protein/serine/threonine protein kinase
MNERSIFMSALERESPQDRLVYLDEACGRDTALRQRVEALLASHERAGSFLDMPVPERLAEKVATPATEECPRRPPEGQGSRIGAYKLLQELGEGGMGTVWMAEQTQPVQRKVALKIIKPGMDSRQVIARFEAERQALALMDHPHIARVFDGGTTESGRPYFVMELVKGVPITKYCDEQRLTPRQRLELFAPICQAVQHAHQKGIIHRDLKPSNVLVCLYDGRPVPKVIDFGVAKATGQKLTERTMFTEVGQVVGTLEYMSPEQAELNQLDVDTRSDIYSLGVLLYELLTGSTPLEKKRLKSAAMLEVLRLIREEEPPRPSTRLAESGETLPSISAQRKTEPARLTKLVRGELDWIVMKSLEKDRNRRYETANAFAMDVQRYLHDEPVLACPPSAWYRIRKFARRKKAALGIAACVFLALAGVAGSIGWAVRDKGAREEGIERERLAREAALDQIVESSLDQAADLLESGSWPEAGADIERTDKLLRAAGRTERPPRLVQLGKDVVLAQHLEKIYRRPIPILRGRLISRGPRTNPAFEVFEMHVDWADEEFISGHKPDAEYAEVFAKAGLDPSSLCVGEVAERIAAMRIRRELVRALDLWSFMRHRSETQGGGAKSRPDWKQLLDIAMAADPDPWRNQLRAACKRGDRQGLAALAASPDISQRGPDSLFLLASALEETGGREQAIALARRAVLVYADDWWLNSFLGAWCLLAQPPRYDEALCYVTAAQAIRPRNPDNLVNVGSAWKGKKAYAQALSTFARVIDLKPDYANGWFNRGTLWGDLKQWDKAVADLNNAIRLDPKSAVAWSNRGHCYNNLGQYDKAIGDLNEAIELDPKSAVAWNNRGICYSALKQYDKAIADYTRAIELDAKNMPAWYNQGTCYNEQKQYDKALASHTKAIELDPKNAEAWINRGNDYWGLKQYDKAIADYNMGIKLNPKLMQAWVNRADAYRDLKQYEKAVADYAKAIELDPKNALVWYHQGTCYNELNQYDKALASHTKAIELEPKKVEAWINRGNDYWGLKQYDKAVADYTTAIDLDARHVLAWLNRANAYKDLEQYDKAIADYTKGVELDPQNASARNDRGNAYWHLKEYDQAVADYTKAIELDPKNASRWHNRGNAYWHLKQYDKAIPDLTKAIELDAKNASAWYNRGQAYRDLKQYDKALADYTKAIELGRKDMTVWNDRGNAYSDLKQYDKAVADFSKVIELDPKCVPAWNNRGNAYRDLKQYDKALADLTKAIELDPKNAILWDNRGLAYLQLKQHDKAVADFTRAIELDPKNAWFWSNRGSAHLWLRQYHKAVADYTKAIELDQKRASVWYDRGNAYNELKQYDKAVADFSKVIELDPKDVSAWDNRGTAYQRLGQYDKAIADFSQTIALNPRDAQWHNLLAWLLATCPDAKQRDPKRAVELAQKAVHLAPDDGNYWNTLGMAHYRTGDWKAAALAIQTSMEKAKGANASDWFILAMARWKLGDRLEARKRYDQAVEWMEKNEATLAKDPVQAEELRHFRSEAEEVLELKDR